MAVNVNELTYGVEIECYVPDELVRSGRIRIGAYHHGNQVTELPAGWNAQHDGSLGGRRGRQGVEIVSPVLAGAEGLRQIQQVTKWLREMGATVSVRCGFHVHVGFAEKRDRLDTLVALASNFEGCLYASTGTKRRERGGFCHSIQRSPSHQQRRYEGVGRYHVLNVRPLLDGTKPTVEFRAFAGTLDSGKIIAHVRQCLALVEKACETKRRPKWIAKATVPTSPLARKGKGLSALTRFLYRMGWTRGQAKHVYGAVEGEGLPSIEQSKKVLRRLARK